MWHIFSNGKERVIATWKPMDEIQTQKSMYYMNMILFVTKFKDSQNSPAVIETRWGLSLLTNLTGRKHKKTSDSVHL